MEVSRVKLAGYERRSRERRGVRSRYGQREPAGEEIAPIADGKGYIWRMLD